jgi:lysophospholipase L1-like esterase
MAKVMPPSRFHARRRRPLRGREIAFALAVMMAVLVAAEVFLRVSAVGRNPYDDFYDNVHDVFFQMVPGAMNPYSALRDKLNHYGFRGRDLPEAKPPGTVRVLCLGDSCTFGYGLPVEESYPAQMQKLFDEGGGPRVEVINGGIPGTNLYQQLAVLRTKFLRFAPDVVVVWSAPNWVEAIKRYRDRATDPPFYVALQRPLRRLALYRALVSRLTPPPRDKAYYEQLGVASETPGKTPIADYLLDYRADLEELRALAAAHGFALLLTNYPNRESVLERDLPPPHDASYHWSTLHAFCREAGVPLIDLVAPQKGIADASFFLDRAHPTAKGAAVIARTVHDAIVQGGTLARAGGGR